MKNINFIKTLSISQQKSLRQWWFVSCALSVLCGALVLCLHGLQIYQWHTLFKESQTLQTALNGMCGQVQIYQKAQTEQQLLQQKKTKCDRVTGGMLSVRDTLTSIRAACIGTGLQSCKSNKQNVELIFDTPTAAVATAVLAQMQKIKGLGQLRLVSLHKGAQDRHVATLRAKLQ